MLRRFDQSDFDELIYPYLQEPNQIPARLMADTYYESDIVKEAELEWTKNKKEIMSWFIGKLTNKTVSNKLEIAKNFTEGQKPDILCEESTVAYLKD